MANLSREAEAWLRIKAECGGRVTSTWLMGLDNELINAGLIDEHGPTQITSAGRDYLAGDEVVVAEGYVSVIPLQGTRICEEPDPTPRGVYVNHMFDKYKGKRVQVIVREIKKVEKKT